jgi:hypothetical protein
MRTDWVSGGIGMYDFIIIIKGGQRKLRFK